MIGRQTVVAGNSNGDGWASSDGFFGQLAIASLAGMEAVFPNNSQVRQAYDYIIHAGAPHTDKASFQGSGSSPGEQYHIVPPSKASRR
jgi:hypothetical protein